MNVHIYVHMYKYMFISNLKLLYLFKNQYTTDYMVRDFFSVVLSLYCTCQQQLMFRELINRMNQTINRKYPSVICQVLDSFYLNKLR